MKRLQTRAGGAGNDDATGELVARSTLTATQLTNGGVAGSLGTSSSAASNVVLHDGTLKYAGNTPANTDRLFTVGSAGATLEAAGNTTSDRVVYNNTGALAIAVAPTRKAVISTGVVGDANNTIFGLPSEGLGAPFSTEDLVPGMRVFTTQGDFNPPTGGSPIRITSIPGTEVVLVGQPVKLSSESDNQANTLPNAWPGYGEAGDLRDIQFGPAPARFLTLTGANQGDNTLAPSVANAGAAAVAASAEEIAAGYGTVGIRKQGAGKWILTNNNTYSGATNVEAGTLLINGNQTGAGLTTVSSGAKFGGTGQIGGGLTMLEGSIFTATGVGGVLDALDVLGNVDLQALGNVLNVTGITTGTHTLMTYAGTLMGTFESTPGFTVDYGTGTNSMISIMATSPTALVGDYNDNGKVDAADYTIWRNNLGNAGSTLGANRDPANGGLVSAGRLRILEGQLRSSAWCRQQPQSAEAFPEPTSLTARRSCLRWGGFVKPATELVPASSNDCRAYGELTTCYIFVKLRTTGKEAVFAVDGPG